MKLTQEGPSPCPHASCETKLNLESQQLLLNHIPYSTQKERISGRHNRLVPSLRSQLLFLHVDIFAWANIWSMDDIGQRDYI